MAELPPPSYDDVLAAGSSRIVPMAVSPATSAVSPTSPPSGTPRVTSGTSMLLPGQQQQQQQRVGGRSQGRASSAEGRRSNAPRSSTPQSGSRSAAASAAQRRQQYRHKEDPSGCGERIARFSMPTLMLAGISRQEELDPELDHEAHLPGGISHSRLRRRRRLQCLCGCLWCFGFSLLFFFVALPVAMIMAAIFGMDSCPYMNNLVISYLFAGGGLLAVSVTLRLCSSTLTCCKTTNVWNTARSSGCSFVISVTEGLFIISVVLNVALVVVGGYLVLSETPQPEPASATGDDNYCDPGIYTSAMIFIGFTAVLALCLVVVLMLAGCCYTTHKDLYSQPGAAHAASSQSRRALSRNSQRTTSF